MLVDDKNPDYGIRNKKQYFISSSRTECWIWNYSKRVSFCINNSHFSREEPLDKVFHFMEKAVENTISTTTKVDFIED